MVLFPRARIFFTLPRVQQIEIVVANESIDLVSFFDTYIHTHHIKHTHTHITSNTHTHITSHQTHTHITSHQTHTHTHTHHITQTKTTECLTTSRTSCIINTASIADESKQYFFFDNVTDKFVHHILTLTIDDTSKQHSLPLSLSVCHTLSLSLHVYNIVILLKILMCM